MSKWDNFKAWKQFTAAEEGRLLSPFASKKITAASVFLYVQSTAPLPAATMFGQWFSYPGIKDLVSHLRFGILPELFGVWLCRGEWDEEGEPMALEELFAGARKAEIRYVVDIPTMEKIAALLEQAAGEEPDLAFDLVGKAVRAFNRRWKRTQTWDFELKLFDDLETLVRDVRKKDCTASFGELPARGLGAAILADGRLNRRFRELLHEAACF